MLIFRAYFWNTTSCTYVCLLLAKVCSIFHNKEILHFKVHKLRVFWQRNAQSFCSAKLLAAGIFKCRSTTTARVFFFIYLFIFIACLVLAQILHKISIEHVSLAFCHKSHNLMISSYIFLCHSLPAGSMIFAYLEVLL